MRYILPFKIRPNNYPTHLKKQFQTSTKSSFTAWYNKLVSNLRWRLGSGSGFGLRFSFSEGTDVGGMTGTSVLGVQLFKNRQQAVFSSSSSVLLWQKTTWQIPVANF